VGQKRSRTGGERMKFFEITDLTDDENFVIDENGKKYTYEETIELLNQLSN